MLAQTRWVVDFHNRPGAHFTDLPAAVAAAVSGDVILLRATDGTIAESYLAPSIQSKGLTIVGETGPGVPRVVVTGSWTIDAIPAGQTMIVSNMTITNAPLGQGPFGVGRRFTLLITNCQGGVIFQGVDGMRLSVFDLPVLSDNALLVFSGCGFDNTTGWLPFTRSNVMMDSTVLLRTQPQTGSSAPSIYLLDSELHLAGCRLWGANWSSLSTSSSPVIEFDQASTRGALYVNGTCRLEAGVNAFGGRVSAVRFQVATANCSRVHMYLDPNAIIIEGFNSYCMPITRSPVSGLRTTSTAGTLQIHHDTTPNALTILLMAPLQTTPWNGILGPVFLDQNFVWSSLDVAPANGPLTRNFTIPPTIPLGQWVGVQAFEYDQQNNRVIGTNATIVGVL